ncbi:MAG TPA: putative RNA uridine N3 methyltransferase [Nitrososphaerales archaeon]|nr:putative RNA uridine N3 methyltransferase [Nitrososphaerales archaeon]
MTLAGKKVCVAFPDTVLEEQDGLREKTAKLGQIARYCSIFGVDTVRIFRDARGRGESAFIKKVLEYLETPQYLRRRLFPLSEDLRFAGLLPPLRIPSHKPKVPIEKLRPGEFREGVVLADGVSVEIGFEIPAELRRRETPQKRITVRIISASQSRVEAVQANRSEVPEYWGYTVDSSPNNPLQDHGFPLKIATSRKGDALGQVSKQMRIDLHNASGVMLLFGSPSRGLFEMLGKDLKDSASYVVNLFASQRVVTVRTEEAMFSALYLVELFVSPDTPPFS